jgi:23S rRNA (cytosine1962-C5)-methyltransferase
MDRRRIWPDFRDEDVLYEDDDLLVVQKPAGVPSQSATEREDDLVARLKAWLASRGRGTYLGVHQRLDRDTSGVMLFTRRPDLNPAVAAAFEGRTVEKRYLAGVVGWPKRAPSRLEDELAKGDDGRMIVVPPRQRARGPGPRRGKRAITRIENVRRNGDRVLLELVLETGRTHQARVQLAHAGAPIAGDLIYGSARGKRVAPRLMLHASAITILHPRTKKPLVVRSRGTNLEAWLAHGHLGHAIYDDAEALRRALALAVERRWGLGQSELRDPPERKTTAFRLVDEEGDALPGLAVDVYGAHLVAQIYVSEEWQPSRRERVLDALHTLGFEGVFLKLRPKQANLLVDTRRDDLAPREPVRGRATPDPLTIHEEGVPFEVRLGDGLSTGIFLDQRANRRAVRAMAEGLRVANLFAYTCGFSIVAALGGAARTVSVDASAAALERGRAGFGLAGMPLDARHTFAAEDAFAWLARTERKSERFDLVILDPPSYSSTKKRRFVAESDYHELVTAAVRVLAPGGRILASCNHRGLSRTKLRRMVHRGTTAAGRTIAQLKDLPDPSDHPGSAGMKSVLLKVD